MLAQVHHLCGDRSNCEQACSLVEALSPGVPDMCNLYSVTKGQQAIRELTRAMHDTTGNLPPMPAVFPDYAAPVVRKGELEHRLFSFLTTEANAVVGPIHPKAMPVI